MSFWSKALTVVGAVVGIAAAVASGGTLGFLAAAFIGLGAAANLGIIGGSVGKFMNSGWGRGLLAAVTIGSAYTAMYGQTALAKGVAEQSATGAAEMHATVAGTMANDATTIANDAAATNASFLQSANMGQEISAAQIANPELSTANVAAGSLARINTQITSPLGANAEGAAASQTAATEQAGQTIPSAATKSLMTGQDAGAGATVPASAATPPSGAITPPAGAATPAAAAPAASSGWLGKAADFMNSKGGSALIQGGGSMLGGLGNGIAQKQATEDALKAQQWGNLQWQNQAQVDQMQAAAAKPITVPQGYLQRAQQTRALMQGNQGVQPLPAASPGAPLAPSPVHI